MTQVLITASFIAGLIPLAILFVLYGFRTEWMTSVLGWLLFGMITVAMISFGLSLVVLLWPDIFRATHGEWFRIILRFALDAVIWVLLGFFIRTQRRAVRASRRTAGKVAE